MFNAGDHAKCDVTDYKVEVQFGPVTSSGSGEESYLVKWLEGDYAGSSSIMWACDLTALPKYEVGQAVKFSYDTDIMEVVSGPFPSDGDNLWIVKDEKGFHYSTVEEYMVPVVE